MNLEYWNVGMLDPGFPKPAGRRRRQNWYLNSRNPRKRQITHQALASIQEEPDFVWNTEKGPHPLQNAVVLHLLFNFLGDNNDLKVCRLVNQTWNRHVLPHLQRRGYACVMLEVDETASENVFSFMDCVQASPQFPFTKLNLECHDEMPETAWNVLLRFVSPWLTALRVYCYDAQIFGVPENAFFPKLQALVCNFYGQSQSEHSKLAFITQILAEAFSLQHLELVGVAHDTIAGLQDLLKDLHLETLKVKAICSENSSTILTMEPILESQRETLRTLGINQGCDVYSLIPVPLPELRWLHLKKDPFKLAEPLDYAALFPMLTTLVLQLKWSKVGNATTYFTYMDQPLTSVVTLEMPGDLLPEFQPLVWENVPKLFPNVRSLKINACHGFVLELVEKLERVEELVLTNEGHDWDAMNRVFTGLAMKEIKSMSRLSKQRIREEMQEFKAKLEQKPYSVLHRIRVLKLEYPDIRFPLAVPICRLVFLQMDNLGELHFNGKLPKTKVFMGMLEEMKNKFLVLSQFPPSSEA